MTQFRDIVSSSLNVCPVLSREMSLLQLLRISTERLNKYTRYEILSSLIRWNSNICYFAARYDVFDVTDYYYYYTDIWKTLINKYISHKRHRERSLCQNLVFRVSAKAAS